MNKTRMGKRVASLLLSLVMMLSLLPTAAYAAMGDADETQGASVSENGTRVSDDSNSGGDTGDLQVGGSSGSGTADDTTGAEGGADPTDSVNGNDSADPQDDGDAVLPVASSVVSTSEELVAAITAASDGDTITLGAGEFTTYGSTSPKKSLTFVGAGAGTVWTIGDLDKDVGGEGNGDCSFEGCDTITFKKMTLKVDNKNYRGFIRINHTVVEDCTLEGRTAYWGYETAKFVNSTFVAPEGDYALWDYSTKDMSFDGCTFTISGKGVNVYVEAGNADKDVTRTVAVNNCTVNSSAEGKAFLNIKNSTQSYDVTLSGENTVTGLAEDSTTGSALYQVQSTEVTETTGNPVTVKQENTAGELVTVYEVKQPSANVAKVGSTEYATLADAIAALSGSSYTLELLDETAWNVATPVYWAAGTQSGFVATLADALTAAYKANVGAITIVCRPGADVGKLTHGHVADNITIYGNNAYISSGECELEVDTFMYSRETGKQVTTGGAYLDKDITVTAYELDNLGVWGERHTDHKVTVNLTDCDTVNGITVQRVYISGTTGMNDITLTGCDFGTKATSVYSNADGAVVIDNCSFTGAQVPVNFNHKAGGTQTVTVRNSKFTNCGDNDAWKQFAAPVRFVNSGSGTMTTSVDTCTFTGTVGGNGDILLGDGREGQKSNDVTLTVKNTAANVQAQQPGYYGDGGTKDESKLGEKTVAAGETLTTSVNELVSDVAYVAAVGEKKFDSLQAAIDAAGRNATVRLLADTRENVTISTNYLTLDLNGHTLNGGQVKAKPALTVTARVTVKDSSAEQTGTIMREDTAENSGVSSHYVIDIQDGWLFFESGNVTNNSGNDSGKGASLVRVGDDSIAKYPGLTISGGTFTQDNFIVIKVDRGTFYLKEDGTLNSKNSYAVENWKFAEIKGGTVNGTVAAWTYSGGHNSDLTISGGTVNGNVASVSYDKAEGKVAKVSITGGTVTGTLGTYTYGNGLIPIEDATKATIAVTGGTFKEDPSKYVVEDSAITPNDDGTYGVAKAYLAKVGDTSYYTMDEAFKAQTDSRKAIVMLRDYTTGSTFNSGSINRTVDLNGHTWTCTGTDANSAAFEINYPDASLTVKNGKVVSSQLVGLIPSAMGGTIKYDNSSLVFYGVEMTTTARSGNETNGNNTNDTVTLRNSTLNVPNGFGIYFPSSGTLTIVNSVINAKTMGVQVCSGSLNISGAGTAITVSGDGIPKTINDGAIEDGAAISIVNRTGYKGLSNIEVKGGTFTAKAGNDAVKAYKWENQTESAFDNSKNVVAVSGGTFSSAVDKSLCADGFIPTDNGNGTYGVKEGKYVAEIGSQGYESLQAAIDAAKRNDTVTLLADTRENVTISTYGLTLDLNGHTLNGGTVKATPALKVDNCSVTVKDSSAEQTGTIMREDTAENSGVSSHYVIDIQGKYGFLKFEGGNVKNNSGTTSGKGASLIRLGNDNNMSANPTLTIKGGTFTQDNFIAIKVDHGTLHLLGGTVNSANSFAIENWNNAYIKGGTVNGTVSTWVYSTGAAFSKLTISGGTVNGNVASVNYDNAADKQARVYVTGGTVTGTLGTYTYKNGLVAMDETAKATIEVTGGTFKEDPTQYVVEGSAINKNDDGTFGVAKAYLAKIGETSYYTMDEAFHAAVASGETLTLLRDYTTGSSQNSGSNSFTIDLNGFTWTYTGKDVDCAAFEINYSDVTLTVKNGKVVSSQLAGLIPSAMSGTITYDNSGLVFENVEMTANGHSGIETNGSNTNDTVTLRNSTLNVPNGYGIYFPSSGTLTIDNSKINAKTMGVQVCSGSLNVTGADTAITVSGDGIEKTGNDGAIEDGAAISIVERTGYKGLSEIKVSGGTFTANGTNDAVKAYKWENQTASGFTQDDKVSVSGGTFSSAVDKSLCAEGFIPTDNGNGTYGVKEGKYVAEIGSQGYESLQEAINAAQDGQTVTLLADATEDVVINKSITLDLGGKTLTNTNAGKATISVTGGTVTVKNGNVVGGTDYYNIEVTKGSGADLTLTDVTATAGNNGSSMIDNYGTLTITSGTYTGGLDTVKNESSAKLNITGGTFTLTKGTSKGFTGVVFNYGELTISGGTFIQSDKSAPYGQAQVIHTDKSGSAVPSTVITGGTFKNLCTSSTTAWTVRATNAAAGATKVSGGAFNKAVKDYYCAEGFIPTSTKDADGNYGVKVGKYVAEVGSKKYETLADAIRLATKGKTVTLLCDVEQNAQLTINKNITLDLNGKTIKNTVDIWGKDTNAILSITNGAKVTITGNGTIDAKENDCYTINVVKGDLTIENGTFYGNVSVVQVQEGTLSVKGGTFDLHQKWEGSSKYLFNCIDNAYVDGSANVAISGGTFVGFDPNVSPEQKVDGKTPSFAAPGAGITKNEDGSFTAAAGMTAQILDKDGNSVKAYRTLAEAVAAAEDGQTVRLLADVTESNIKVNANITIDLNKMTVTGSFVTNGEVTIQNGTIDVPDGKTNYAYGKLTLADVDITGKAASSSLLSVNYNGSVTIDKDSTIVANSAKGDYPAVFIKGQDDSGKTYAPELNIYGTVQSAKTPAIQGNGTDRGVSHVNVFEGAVVKSESLAVYLPQPCEVNITGGLVEGYCGIGIKSGTLNISGGTVRGVANDNVIGDQYSQTNGISYDGSAIMIDSYIGYAGQVQINISGNAVVESKYSTAIREIGNDKSQTNLVGLDITGGTVLGAEDTVAVLVRDVTAKDVNISGGEFSSIVKKEYCAPGFTPVTTANSEGRYGVAVGKFTVKVTSRTTGSDSPVANVAGGGSDITYAAGTKVMASAISGYNFVGWFVDEYPGTAYSTDLTCEVKPTDDCTMIAVYEPISGGVFALEVSASKFTVNGGATQRSYLLEKMPVGTQVTVVFKGSENFLYWVNESGKVVSTSKTYTFPMGSATTLKAVYAEKEENQAMVVFISHTQQVISSKGYTDTQEIKFPEPPIKMGATFVRWSMTEAEIRAAMATTATGIIVVEPVYEFSAGSYTVTVNYPNDETATYTATVGKITTVTAKSIDGKVFKCWKNGDTVLGYTETLRIAPRGDLTLTAEYVDAGTTVDRLPVIALTEISASQQGAKYAVSFTATRSVPDGYTVTEQGVLVSTDSRYGEAGALDAMKLDADGDEPDNTKSLKATNTDATGVTVLNGIVSAADRTVYGRAYMILRDSSGAMVYVYSDTILSGSYNSLTTNGGN